MRTLRARALAVALLATSACTAEFTPRSFVDDLRILALVASPLEAGPADEVTLRAVTVPPPGGALAEERWTFCPVTAGATAAYACALPACEATLTPAADGSVRVSPGASARACLEALAAGAPLPVAVPAQLPAQVTATIRYVAVATDGESREAVQRLTLYTQGDPPVRNQPPVITAVQIGGRDVLGGGTAPTLAAGQGLAVRVVLDPGSAETYVDAAGASLRESLVVSFYTTAGRFDYDRASGPDAVVRLGHDRVTPGTVEARVWAVARDLRGGEAVVGPFRIPITP